MANNQESKVIPGTRNNESLDALKFGDGTAMSLRELFGKRFDGSVILREFELLHRPVQTMVRRDFIYLSRSFYVASVLAENKNIDQTKLDRLDERLGSMFDAVRTLVRQRAKELGAMMLSAGAADEIVHTSRPMVYKVPIIHPRAFAFMELLREIDTLQSDRDRAWMLNHIDSRQRSDNFREVMKAFRRVGQVTRENRIVMWKMLQTAADETGGEEGQQLRDFAVEQRQTLTAELKLDPETMGSITGEGALPDHDANDAALPAEAGAASQSQDIKGDSPGKQVKKGKPIAEPAAA
jgi:hypothetical protein